MDLNRAACEILDIPETDDALVLLSISRGRLDIPAIKAGLGRRLSQLAIHPKNCEKETEEIREYLKGIAAELCSSAAPQASDQKRFLKLTPLDKRIIATLVAEGGWNQKSRSRLVAVAMSYRITVGGLTRILEALAEAARLGDGPLSIEKRTKHAITRQWATLPTPEPNHDSPFDTLVHSTKGRLNLDFNTQNKVLTVKLCAFFAILALFIMFLAVGLLLSSGSGSTNSSIEIVTPNVTSSILEATEVTSDVAFKPLFSSVPTFQFPELALRSLNYSDVALEEVQNLQRLAQTIQESFLKGESPSEDWILQWDNAIESVSIGWPFLSNDSLEILQEQFINAIRRAEMSRDYAQVLLQRMKPPAIRVGAPLAVLQRTWSVGMLAAMKCSPLLTPNTRSYAATLQLETIKTCDSSAAREECLDLISISLLDTTEFDSRTLTQWEAWMIATSSIANQESSNARYMRVIEAVVNSNLDLLRESNTRKVLGRISLENETIKSNQFRDGVLALYKDTKTTSVDLHVLGNLFYSSGNSTWFSPQLILKLNATAQERISTTSLLAQTWVVETKPLPLSKTPTLPNKIDTSQLQSWQVLYSALDRDSGLAEFLIQTRLLNEAAMYLYKGRSDLVDKVFSKIETIKIDAPPILPQVYFEETDGKWSSTFNQSPSTALTTLAQSGATAIGTKDASTLARAALAMHSNQVRAQATDIIISQFYNDKNLAVAMLDYVGNYKSKKELAKLVANLTEIILPESSNVNWNKEARRAIVQHAISTIQPEQKQLDYISNELAISLLDEFIDASPMVVLPSTEYSPLKAIRMLVQAKKKSQGDDSSLFVFKPSTILQHYLHNQLEYYQLISASIFNSGSNDALFAKKIKAIVQNDRTIIEQIASIEFLVTSNWDLFFSQSGIASKTGALSR